MSSVRTIPGAWTEAQALEMSFSPERNHLLGHKVSEEGMKPGDDGLRGIAEMILPANYTEIQRFLGATGFFQCFIKNYAWIVKPLNNLLEGEASKWKTQPVDLPPEAKEAFDILKMKCMTAPVLTFADFENLSSSRPMPPPLVSEPCSPRNKIMANFTRSLMLAGS